MQALKNFIKKIVESRGRAVTFIILDDSKPDEDNSYTFRPETMLRSFGFLIVFAAALTAIIFMFTPAGALLYNTGERQIRNEILNLGLRVNSLEDSLSRRDEQLEEMKRIIRLSVDTTLTMDPDLRLPEAMQVQNSSSFTNPPNIEWVGNIGRMEMLFYQPQQSEPVFPVRLPVQGTRTRSYIPEEEHFGLDIATKENESVLNVADGTVTTASWTVDNGYVMSIQHQGGYVTVYKHLKSLNKKEGNIVLKGDILGTTGDIGILSTGPHLHFEIWKNGVPQNPDLYLTN